MELMEDDKEIQVWFKVILAAMWIWPFIHSHSFQYWLRKVLVKFFEQPSFYSHQTDTGVLYTSRNLPMLLFKGEILLSLKATYSVTMIWERPYSQPKKWYSESQLSSQDWTKVSTVPQLVWFTVSLFILLHK